MPQNYTPEYKTKNVRLHLEEERTMKSITAEFGVSKASISKWCREFSEECHKQAKANPGNKTELELMQENRRLRREPEEAKKENLFLKKQRHSLQRKLIRGLSDLLSSTRTNSTYAGCFSGYKTPHQARIV